MLELILVSEKETETRSDLCLFLVTG